MVWLARATPSSCCSSSGGLYPAGPHRGSWSSIGLPPSWGWSHSDGSIDGSGEIQKQKVIRSTTNAIFEVTYIDDELDDGFRKTLI